MILYVHLLLFALCAASFSSTSLRDDLVIAFCSCTKNLRLARASRCMRKGIRTFIALENETLVEELNRDKTCEDTYYAFFPDSPLMVPSRRGRHEGRWLMTPILAHEHYKGKYKWMLLGDDDTVWLPTGVETLLSAYDFTQPYFISDSVSQLEAIEGRNTPSMMVGKADSNTICLPCHTPQSVADKLWDGLPDVRGCPCTSDLGCSMRRALSEFDARAMKFKPDFLGSKSKLCTSPTSAVGGHGIILSATLMDEFEKKGFADKARIMASQQMRLWGDYALAQLIFDLGFSLTFPIESLSATGHIDHALFKMFGLGFSLGILDKIDNLVANPTAPEHQKCPSRNCSWLLIHGSSLHIHRQKSQINAVESHLSNILCPRIKKALQHLGIDNAFIE